MNIRPTPPNVEVIAYRRKDAAKIIGVSDRFLDRFIADGTLPHVRLGGACLILKSDLEGFLAARRSLTTTGGSQ